MPTPVSHPLSVDGVALSTGGRQTVGGYYPYNRHALKKLPQKDEARNRVVYNRGKRMKVPVALQERPDWSTSSVGRGTLAKGDWSDIRNIEKTVKELTEGRQVEGRLHAAFALSRCSQEKPNRIKLASTPGVIEALGGILQHAEPSESGKRYDSFPFSALPMKCSLGFDTRGKKK